LGQDPGYLGVHLIAVVSGTWAGSGDQVFAVTGRTMNTSNGFLRGAVSEDQRFFIINWEVPKRLLGG